jgi:phosphoesterase RecJ-like protein
MRLADLCKTDRILIQCHDNPDADGIASGFALFTYFSRQGIKARLGYGGKTVIAKPSLQLLIQELKIPIEHIEETAVEGLLVTVDCQYGAGNVKRIAADDVAIIDHHQQEVFDIPKAEIRSYLGSCSSLVWRMLLDEGFDVNDEPAAATALYYGLYTDTNGFAELNHPIDRDMKDSLNPDMNLFKRLKYTNLTLTDLETAGMALIRTSYNRKNRFAVIKTNPCDPNILGFISDLAQQVNAIDVCVVYSEVNSGIKFSVRSALNEIMASDLAAWLTEGIGSGGGHAEKAGGFISGHEFLRLHPNINTDEYMLSRLSEYYTSFEVIYADRYEIDTSSMKLYRKNPVTCGYVRSRDILPDGVPLFIRTLEGDLDDIVSHEDLYFMIGIKGEVNPISREVFEKSYRAYDDPFNIETEYFPSIRNKITGEIFNLKDRARICIPTGESFIYARPLKKTTKIFTMWDRDTYMLGKPGDFLAARKDDLHDIYIIKRDIFLKTYGKADLEDN